MSILQESAVPVPACARNGLDHDFSGSRSPNCRNLAGSDQFQDADIKDPCGTSKDVCSPSPDPVVLLSLPALPETPACAERWRWASGPEFRITSGCWLLNTQTIFPYTSACLSSTGFQSSRQLTGPGLGVAYRSEPSPCGVLVRDRALCGKKPEPTFRRRTVSYTHLTLPTTGSLCRSRWSPYH